MTHSMYSRRHARLLSALAIKCLMRTSMTFPRHFTCFVCVFTSIPTIFTFPPPVSNANENAAKAGYPRSSLATLSKAQGQSIRQNRGTIHIFVSMLFHFEQLGSNSLAARARFSTTGGAARRDAKPQMLLTSAAGTFFFSRATRRYRV